MPYMLVLVSQTRNSSSLQRCPQQQTNLLRHTFCMQPIPSPPLLALCAQLALGQKIAIFCQRKSYVLNAHRLMLVTLKQKRRHAAYSFPPSGPLCTTCVRSKDCHLLSKEVVCVKCTETRNLVTLKQKRRQKSDMQPLKPNNPLHATSNKELKIVLKSVRQS